MPSTTLTTGPASIITPRNATVVNGVVNIDLSAITAGQFGPFEVNLQSSAARAIRWRPGFAGTLTRVSVVLSGATVATGPATVAVGVAATPATLSAPISFAAGQAAGAVQDVAVTAGGVFTADQTIDITPGGTNSAATFGGVVVEYERA